MTTINAKHVDFQQSIDLKRDNKTISNKTLSKLEKVINRSIGFDPACQTSTVYKENTAGLAGTSYRLDQFLHSINHSTLTEKIKDSYNATINEKITKLEQFPGSQMLVDLLNNLQQEPTFQNRNLLNEMMNEPVSFTKSIHQYLENNHFASHQTAFLKNTLFGTSGFQELLQAANKVR